MKVPLGFITLTLVSLKIEEISSFQITGPIKHRSGFSQTYFYKNDHHNLKTSSPLLAKKRKIDEEESLLSKKKVTDDEEVLLAKKEMIDEEEVLLSKKKQIDEEEVKNEAELRVPKADPLKQSIVPPEIVFFGDPRRPPPVEAANEVKYHGTLLFWARHATVAPRTSADRLATVFPKGRLSPNAPKFRLNNDGLTYKMILDAFVLVMDDLEDSKSFIDSNIDIVPTKLFLRALTSQKLSAQQNNDLVQMEYLKEVRKRYILASDQIFFPLNIEVQKAETRVMTYLARDELREFAEGWDEVEMSLHFATLLSARLTWDSRVKGLLDDIKAKIKDTVGYMAENMRDDLMTREFRKPGVTSEIYTNASIAIQVTMPDLYSKIRPELKFAHEVFYIQDESDIRRFAVKEFCPNNNISPDQLKERLKIIDASIASIQGVDYVMLRLYLQNLNRILCEKTEWDNMDKWYTDLLENGFGFETYEPDVVPTMVALEQRIRDTGNAFTNFNTQVLKMPTKYTEAFSGARPKGADVDNWLERDSEYNTVPPASYEERVEAFRTAYIKQSELRQEAESRLMTIVVNRMDIQDRVLKGSGFVSNLVDEYQE